MLVSRVAGQVRTAGVDVSKPCSRSGMYSRG